MSQFSKIGIISKPDDPAIASTVQSLYRYLHSHALEICADQVSTSFLTSEAVKASSLEEIASVNELVIVVGGDGTILHAAHSLIQKEIPLLGINLGRLGFLADISPNEIEKQLGQILAGDYIEEQRVVLNASLIRDGESLATCCAINDVVVHAKQMVRMIELETRVNNKHVNTLRADGFIVATPTGSTAYALSGGGPISAPRASMRLCSFLSAHTH